MSERCDFRGDREAALMAYVYDEMTGDERTGFESHATGCDMCRAELDSFASVRRSLAVWTPPEPGQSLARPAVEPPGSRSAWRTIPAWAQLAAAVLVFGVAAGAANVRVRYDADGFSMQTGWFDRTPAPAVAQTPAPVEPAATVEALAALERSLRAEIEAARTAGPDVLREARTLIAASERKQETQLALRMGTMTQDLRAQRETDNERLNRVVGSFWSSADREAKLTRNMVNRLAVSVAQR